LLNPTIDHVHEVEHFKVGGTFKIKATQVFPVGKAISVALGLRTLDEHPSVIALIGKDDIDTYRKFLQSNSIPATLVPVDGATRHNTTIVDPLEGTVTHLREAGFTAGKKHVQAIEKTIKSLPRVNPCWVLFSGSLPPGLPDDTYARLVNYCDNLGFKTLIDVSGMPLKKIMEQHKLCVLKINNIELDYLLGRHPDDTEKKEDTRPLSAEDLSSIARDARKLLDDRMECVSITLGAEGGLYVMKAGAYHGKIQDPSGIKVVNTVGAGDAYFAGMIHAMLHGEQPAAVLTEAIASATAKILVHGAGIFSKADHDAFTARVRVTKLP